MFDNLILPSCFCYTVQKIFYCVYLTINSAALVLLLIRKYSLNYIVDLNLTFPLSPAWINMRIPQKYHQQHLLSCWKQTPISTGASGCANTLQGLHGFRVDESLQNQRLPTNALLSLVHCKSDGNICFLLTLGAVVKNLDFSDSKAISYSYSR